MGAMPEEIEALLPQLSQRRETSVGGRTYYAGLFHGRHVVIAFSRWGKVAAASTVTTLLHEFRITDLIFTGVAGAIDPRLNVGDMVVAEKLIQHDLDARPLMSRHEIPLLGKTWIETDKVWNQRLTKSIRQVFEARALHSLISEKDLLQFGIHAPAQYHGEIASGDQFFSSGNQKKSLQESLPNILCVEMEGAAVAQVCYEHQLPFALIRTISDTADDRSPVDFPLFIRQVASAYSFAVLDTMFRSSW